MTRTPATLEEIRERRPEWAPWLDVVARVTRDLENPVWDAAVPACHPDPAAAVPMLGNAAIVISIPVAERAFARLMQVAAQAGTPEMATLGRVMSADFDVLAMYAASIAQQHDPMRALAAAAGVDGDALQAVAALAGVPLLHACRRRCSPAALEGWSAPWCPVCGSWPALVEVRGIERTRRARCGRCGADWHGRLLRCFYCDNANHDELVTLVADDGAQACIEACMRCRGYTKVLTTLQGCAPAAVMIGDLATVDLDVAGLASGYRRPEGAGYPLQVTVSEGPGVSAVAGTA